MAQLDPFIWTRYPSLQWISIHNMVKENINCFWSSWLTAQLCIFSYTTVWLRPETLFFTINPLHTENIVKLCCCCVKKTLRTSHNCTIDAIRHLDTTYILGVHRKEDYVFKEWLKTHRNRIPSWVVFLYSFAVYFNLISLKFWKRIWLFGFKVYRYFYNLIYPTLLTQLITRFQINE